MSTTLDNNFKKELYQNMNQVKYSESKSKIDQSDILQNFSFESSRKAFQNKKNTQFSQKNNSNSSTICAQKKDALLNGLVNQKNNQKSTKKASETQNSTQKNYHNNYLDQYATPQYKTSMKNYNENKENFCPNFNFKDEKQQKKSHFNTDPAEKFQKYYQYQQYQNDKQSHNNNNNINEIFNQNYTNSQFKYNPNQSQHYTTPKQPRTPFNTPVQENSINNYDNINNNYTQQEQENEVNFKQLLMGKNMVDQQQKHQNNQNNNNEQNEAKSGYQRHKQLAKTKSQLKLGVLFLTVILIITQIIGANSSQTFEELDKAEQILLEYSQTDFGEFQNDTYMETQNINIIQQQKIIEKQKNKQHQQQQPLINQKKQSQQVELDESESIIQNEQNISNNNIIYSQQASQKVIENITKQVYEDLNQYLFEHQQYAQKDFIEFLESEYSSSTVNSIIPILNF